MMALRAGSNAATGRVAVLLREYSGWLLCLTAFFAPGFFRKIIPAYFFFIILYQKMLLLLE
jgi:hypothetical protein